METKKRILVVSLLFFLILACTTQTPIKYPNIDFRQEMKAFVIGMSEYSKNAVTEFYIIPQNGIELVGSTDETPDTSYLNAIDGNGQEDLYYGYTGDNIPSPETEREYLKSFLNISRDAGKTILITDYCSTPAKMDDSYQQNSDSGYISFAADHRELDNIPDHPELLSSENNRDIEKLIEISNFLYLINPGNFNTKSDFITAVTASNYDLIIMDLFFNDNSEFSKSEIEQLRSKANGGRRLIIAYMSIGEAEDYRYYWKEEWNTNPPSWLNDENPDWAGNYKVTYWDSAWQDILFGNDASYLKKIIDAGFDGVYLDIIDAFEYFES